MARRDKHSQPPASEKAPRKRRMPWVRIAMRSLPILLVDVALIVLFALIGRWSHDEPLTPGGIAETAWPFATACALISVLLVMAFQRNLRPAFLGILVWIGTVAGGMGLRSISGGGTDPAFVVVATVVLLLFLVGWRAVPIFFRAAAQRSERDAQQEKSGRKHQREGAAEDGQDREEHTKR